MVLFLFFVFYIFLFFNLSAVIRRDEQLVYKAAKRLVEELSWLLNKRRRRRGSRDL